MFFDKHKSEPISPELIKVNEEIINKKLKEKNNLST